MTDSVFLDTNLWVYLYSKQSQEKFQKVEALIIDESRSIQISTQVLGELFHTLTRKKIVPEAEAQTIVLELINGFPISEIGTAQVLKAIEIRDRYGYTYWDSLILATAILNNCKVTTQVKRL